MLNYNPATTGSLVQLLLGGLPPGVDGALLQARLRYFDPLKKRAGVPDDVAALVSEITDTKTVVTLVNLSKTESRSVIVQGGTYGEHQIIGVQQNGKTTPVNSAIFAVDLQPSCGQQLVLEVKRYANAPSVKHPWQR
jgi:hypothetical protein